MNPLQYKFDFWMFIRGNSHGFDRTIGLIDNCSEFQGYYVTILDIFFQEQRGGDCS